MPAIKYKLFNETAGIINVIESGGVFSFFYPCFDTHKCTEYELSLSAGVYKIEVYGGSGGFIDKRISLYRNSAGNGCVTQEAGGNTECRSYSSMAGAGGYSTGYLTLNKVTRAFLSIGGMGTFGYKILEGGTDNCYLKENMMPGGYNGGGSAPNFYLESSNNGNSGGGGATDLRILSNDLFHRVIVAGGGGGADNPAGNVAGSDDGSGGAGGGEIAQGYRIESTLYNSPVANQISGFSFGQGESALSRTSLHPNGAKFDIGNSDRAGGGGGWFGGFSSHHGNGGGGGGSSFILTMNSTIPEGQISVYDESYTYITSDIYAFSRNSEYSLRYPSMSSGIWEGNGLAKITFISSFECTKFTDKQFHWISFALLYCLIY